MLTTQEIPEPSMVANKTSQVVMLKVSDFMKSGVLKELSTQYQRCENEGLGQTDNTLGKILVVDDDRHFVLATTLLLRNAGYMVCSAHDVPTALQQILEQEPDLLLLDVRLGDGRGFEILEQLKQLDPAVNVPAIYVTGDTSSWTHVFKWAKGSPVVLRKPFRKQELLLKIKSVLE